DGRDVADRRDVEAGSLEGAQRRFTTRTGAANFDLEGLHAVFLRLLGSIFRGNLGSIRGRLARALEAHNARRGPRNRVALHVGDGDHGVVEGGVDVGNTGGDVLALLATDARDFSFCHLGPLVDIN